MKITLRKEELLHLLKEAEQWESDIIIETSQEYKNFLFFRKYKGEKSLIGLIGDEG